jgi:hypothetical protein
MVQLPIEIFDYGGLCSSGSVEDGRHTTCNWNRRIEGSLCETGRTGFTGNVETDSDAKTQCQRPSFIVLAKDTHPPNGLARILVLAQQLNKNWCVYL